MKTLKHWRSLLAIAALAVSGGAFAVTPTPTSYEGNFTDCDDLPGVGTWPGIGTSTGDAPVNGESYDLGNGQSITFNYTPPGQNQYIGFTATIPMDYIVVKGGNAYNVFAYSPGQLSDTGLYAPDNGSGEPAGVSHVVFCALPKPTGSKTAKATWKRYTDWTVEKSVTPTQITMFDGDQHEAEYTVTVEPTTRGTYRVYGGITAKDPYGFGWTATNVADVMTFNNSATEFTLAWDGPGGNADTIACTTPANDPNKIILSCTYEFILQSTSHPFLLAATGGTNTAAIRTVRQGEVYMLTPNAAFSIPATPAESYGDTLSVDDSMLPGNPDKTFGLGDSYVWTYDKTFTCDADEGMKQNTASGSWSTGPSTSGSASDSATVQVVCETVTVQKTAVTRYSRDYAWTPEKKIVASAADAAANDASCDDAPIVGGTYAGSYLCDDLDIELNAGGSYDTVYWLSAAKSVEDEFGFAVSGSITVSWPAGLTPVFDPANPSDTLTFTDATNGTQAVTPTCGAQGATSLACTYDANLPRDFVPGYNEASIDRVKQCYDAQGNATPCGTRTYTSNQAALTYAAEADVNLDACADLGDLFNGVAGLNLGASFSFGLGNQCASFSGYYTGDVFDGATLLGNLAIFADWILPTQIEDATCEFMVPNLLTVTTAGDGASTDEAIVSVKVPELCTQGCTYTQGYWKTHVDYAAKPQFSKKRDANWDLIGADGEDTLFFASGQSYIAVMWTPPQGNAYYNLAHQYIAAKLNVLSGAGTTPAVASAIAQAEAWFVGRSPATKVSGTARTTAISLAGTLGSYNEGAIGPGHCSESPATLLSSK